MGLYPATSTRVTDGGVSTVILQSGRTAYAPGRPTSEDEVYGARKLTR